MKYLKDDIVEIINSQYGLQYINMPYIQPALANYIGQRFRVVKDQNEEDDWIELDWKSPSDAAYPAIRPSQIMLYHRPSIKAINAQYDKKHFSVEDLLRLPAWIEKDGREYTLEIFSQGSRELRMCYNGDPSEEVEGQPNFLYLVVGIETNEDFAEAIFHIRRRLELDGYSALIKTIEYRHKKLQEHFDEYKKEQGL